MPFCDYYTLKFIIPNHEMRYGLFSFFSSLVFDKYVVEIRFAEIWIRMRLDKKAKKWCFYICPSTL